MSLTDTWKARIIVLCLGGTALLAIGACADTTVPSRPAASMVPKSAMPKDGDLGVALDYKSWPKFLTDINKDETKQVRDIYINPTAARTSSGQAFPPGSMMVMEIYKAQEQADGTLVRGADGKLVKGPLAKVFMMAKGDGWGQGVPAELNNGNWVYSAAGPDGKALAEDFTKCRACHVPLAAKDYVHRYDEYFQKRGGM